jgi:hypothetical protein
MLMCDWDTLLTKDTLDNLLIDYLVLTICYVQYIEIETQIAISFDRVHITKVTVNLKQNVPVTRFR